MKSNSLEIGLLQLFCVDIQSWGKRRLRSDLRRAHLVHASALASDGAVKTSRVLNRVEH